MAMPFELLSWVVRIRGDGDEPAGVIFPDGLAVLRLWHDGPKVEPVVWSPADQVFLPAGL
jgi:hypothetical protein